MKRQSRFQFYEKMQQAIMPGLRSSQYAYRDILLQRLNRPGRWLDLGCGHNVLASWMPKEEMALKLAGRRIFGIDLDESSLRAHRGIRNKVLGNVEKPPFRDESFDLITANMVVEHVEYPEAALAEVYRLLKPGGVFIFHTTNALHFLTPISRLFPKNLKNRVIGFLEGRAPDDIYPTYYRINTFGSVHKMARRSGFEVAELSIVHSTAETFMLGPVVVFELLATRLLNLEMFHRFRSNIVAVLQKPGTRELRYAVEEVNQCSP
jgi:ubiquinone/menaquinone biosynthesis C-methylase UbiE